MKFNKNMLNNTALNKILLKTQEMFKYKNLPAEIDSYRLEYMLQKNARLLFFKYNNVFYCLNGTYTGKNNAYGEFTHFLITNPFINLNKSYKIGDEGIIIKNDSLEMGLVNLLNTDVNLLTEIYITMVLNVFNIRKNKMIVAKDKKSLTSAENYIQKIENGEDVILSDSKFFDDDLKIINTQSQNQTTQELIELNQYIKSTIYNQIGLNLNYNMKRERLTQKEVASNEEILYPLIDNMLNSRKTALKEINQKFNLNIKVELNSSWFKKDQLGGFICDVKQNNRTFGSSD